MSQMSRCLSVWNRGAWEYDATLPPPYEQQDAAAAKQNPQSQKIKSNRMCDPELQQSWRWQWRSLNADCPFERPGRELLCQRLKGRRILLYGDSLTQQHFVSLASLAGNGTEMRRPSECAVVKPLECVSVCDGSSVVCHRLRFGLALDYTGSSLSSLSSCNIKPSVVAPLHETFSPSCILGFDIVVLQEFAHWVGADGSMMLEECLREKGHGSRATSWAQKHILRLYQGQMQRNAAFLQNVASQVDVDRRPRVLLRTAVPGYPPAGVLAPDTPHGEPPVFRSPRSNTSWALEYSSRATSRWNHHLWSKMNIIARRAYREHALEVMDIEMPMLQRVDGHLDELHYCLPGPPDFHSLVLYNFVLPALPTEPRSKVGLYRRGGRHNNTSL